MLEGRVVILGVVRAETAGGWLVGDLVGWGSLRGTLRLYVEEGARALRPLIRQRLVDLLHRREL